VRAAQRRSALRLQGTWACSTVFSFAVSQRLNARRGRRRGGVGHLTNSRRSPRTERPTEGAVTRSASMRTRGRADRWIARPRKRQEHQGGDESGNVPGEEKGRETVLQRQRPGGDRTHSAGTLLPGRIPACGPVGLLAANPRKCRLFAKRIGPVSEPPPLASVRSDEVSATERAEAAVRRAAPAHMEGAPTGT
jgi:hypothetical protein